MPLYKTITVNSQTTVKIWKIEESYDALFSTLDLKPESLTRVLGMKSELHQCGFLSVRHLLKAFGYTDHDLFYDDNGKPHLKDGKHISITHSFTFSGVIISDTEVGIDIEKQRDKIERIAHKFIGSEEAFITASITKVKDLTIVWGAKEALYKSFSTPGISFQQHIHIQPFDAAMPFTLGTVQYKEMIAHYDITFMEFEGFICVYALPYAS